jgi:hypothetical protein
MMAGLVDHIEPTDLKMVMERLAFKVVDIPVRGLHGGLRDHGIAEIHCLSIDREGSELSILRAFDFFPIPVRALSVENNRNTGQIPDPMRGLGSRGWARLGVDDIYAKA